MSQVTIEKQLYIETPNQAGIAGKLNSFISKQANVDVKSEWAGIMDGKGFFTLITSNNERVKEALKNSEFAQFEEKEKIIVRIPDQAGSVAEVTQKIADAGVGINCFYTTIFDNQPAVIISTDDNKKAFSALQ